jgi:uncharacterized protein (DUF1800 family)
MMTPPVSDRNPAWNPYVADDRNPWDVRRVVHLHRRAGFGGTWTEIKRDLAEGPAASIDRFLTGKQTAHAVENAESTSVLLGDSAVASGELNRLKAWWCFRMLLGTDPLGEKLALMWHNHFSTANSKVQDVAAMKRQNDVFLKMGRGPFGDLLNASLRQSALLVYLDAPTNRKGHANENLARELMELFTLGVGNYTEADVKEAARCLTGWTVEDSKFLELPVRHDDGEKTVLGRKGKLNGQNLIDTLLDHPATANRLAWRLCETFLGEGVATPAMRSSLAAGLRERKLDIGWGVATILKSNAFFDPANIGNRVKSPVEFAIGTARSLEMFDPAPSTLALADWCGRMGQDLFEPPNVGGWKGGRSWIGARTMIARANFISALVDGVNAGRPDAYDPTALPVKYGRMPDGNDLLDFHGLLMIGTEPNAALTARLAKSRGKQMIATLLASPEVQLG